MKFSLIGVVIVILLSILAITANSFASDQSNFTYTQCTVDLPTGTIKGVCVNDGSKYYRVYTCEGSLIAHVEPGALSRADGTTCGSNYKGYKP